MLLLGGLVAGTYYLLACRYDLRKVGQIPERSMVYDVHGKVYSRLHGENRTVTTADKVPKYFIDALLAREDTRFYKHEGVDYFGILRAFVHNVLSLSIKEGASTITQQLARNSFPLGGQNLHRKALEAMVAFRIENHYTKKQILEAYVNRIYFGAGVYGLETASQIYFGKSCDKLNLSECAMLVGIIRSPNRFSPFRNYKGAMAQRNAVLERMLKLKMISAKEARHARDTTIRVVKKRSFPVQENYAMDAVQRVLQLILAPEDWDQGGLKIYTTLDSELQARANKIIDQRLDEVEKRKGYRHPSKQPGRKPDATESKSDYLQGALVAIDNRTGGIVAIAGGRDYADSKFNRALQARRQVGSSFKPFIYAAAFESGVIDPESRVDDSQIRPGEIDHAAEQWSPANSDGRYGGRLPAEVGLIDSRNTMTVRIANEVGLKNIVELVERTGLCNDVVQLPSIYLGGFEASPKDLTTAYTLFPNHGVLKQSYLIQKIVNDEGVTIYEANPIQKMVFPEHAVHRTCKILEKVMEEGTGASARALGFRRTAGGKTGTTNDFKDAWFIGFTSSITCGVWVGFDHPRPIMAKGYGSVLALPIWVDFMKIVPEDYYPAQGLRGDIADKVEDGVWNIGRAISDFFGGGNRKREREQEQHEESEP
jgi:penicillin-binding protein 1A